MNLYVVIYSTLKSWTCQHMQGWLFLLYLYLTFKMIFLNLESLKWLNFHFKTIFFNVEFAILLSIFNLHLIFDIHIIEI